GCIRQSPGCRHRRWGGNSHYQVFLVCLELLTDSIEVGLLVLRVLIVDPDVFAVDISLFGKALDESFPDRVQRWVFHYLYDPYLYDLACVPAVAPAVISDAGPVFGLVCIACAACGKRQRQYGDDH